MTLSLKKWPWPLRWSARTLIVAGIIAGFYWLGLPATGSETFSHGLFAESFSSDNTVGTQNQPFGHGVRVVDLSQPDVESAGFMVPTRPVDPTPAPEFMFASGPSPVALGGPPEGVQLQASGARVTIPIEYQLVEYRYLQSDTWVEQGGTSSVTSALAARFIQPAAVDQEGSLMADRVNQNTEAINSLQVNVTQLSQRIDDLHTGQQAMLEILTSLTEATPSE